MPEPSPAAFVAVDLGSASGRVMLGILDDGAHRLSVREVARFANRPVPRPEGLAWDIDALWADVRDGLARACAAAASAGAAVRGIGVDSWGVDYVRLRRDGRMRRFARHHRDVDATFAAVTSASRDAAADYAVTGVLDQTINTAHQLRQDGRDGIGAPDDTIVLIADAFVHLLTGAVAAERSLASTTALVDRARDAWSPSLAAGLPARLPPLVTAGHPAGSTTADVTARLGLTEPVPVWFVTSHDTAAAFSAVVGTAEGDAIEGVVACGSWAVAGAAIAEPVLTETARACGFTQETGAEGATLLVKNLSGMWLLQQVTREWATQDGLAEWPLDRLAQLLEDAAASRYAGCFDPADPALGAPGDLIDRLAARCAADVGIPPQTRGDLARAILASLARAYARTMTEIHQLTGRPVARIRLVGGGSRGDLLAGLTAAAAGVPVTAGPAEASVRGILLQLAVAAGALPDLAAARSLDVDDGEPAPRVHPVPAAPLPASRPVPEGAP
ncbi:MULTISPECIES: rhamnulokinase [Microbacterium]|uniref:Rhamnulokinase n=1 Tax=Microbacterium wangchenii TaxID=2541726 RepID=A0ABX5SYI8_9MICO|nr:MULTISPECIES: FGGY-family carbohydrate kinase [Microbacterium]MCK6065842.1 rhamnulokinase [Microbacterium sp. EYE_512]QBR90148.1 rhamnulokinase [Microbacterium wangchenii]TXK11836.1 rhamnulokinase [Microbacterium wangchenii]